MTLAVGLNASGLSVGPQDTAENSNELLTPVVIGEATVAGQDIALNRVLPVEIGEVTATGIDLGLVIANSLKQLVTVTDTSLQGVEITFYDVLSSVIPVAGDIWWVSTTTTDGADFTLNGDGTFEIDPPTSGPDSIASVQFYDVSTGVWHGPATVTIIDAPYSLDVDPGSLTVAGQEQGSITGLQFDIGELTVTGQSVGLPLSTSPGELTVAGQDIVFESQALDPGVITVTGNEYVINTDYEFDVGEITVAGQDVTITDGIRLQVEAGSITVTGIQNQLHRTMVIDDNRGLVCVGASQDIIEGEPPVPLVLPFSFDTLYVRSGSPNVTSDSITVRGSTNGSNIRVTGDASAAYKVNNGGWRTTSSIVNVGDTIKVRVNASDTVGGTATCTLTIGSESADFTVVSEDVRGYEFRTRDLEVA